MAYKIVSDETPHVSIRKNENSNISVASLWGKQDNRRSYCANSDLFYIEPFGSNEPRLSDGEFERQRAFIESLN